MVFTFMAEDGGRSVSKVCINQLPGDNSMTEESFAWGLLNLGPGRMVRKCTVGKVGVGLTGIRRSVEPVQPCQLGCKTMREF